MILSIDYDETYSRDKIFWDEVIRLAKSRGHAVYCVTARNEQYHGDEVKEDLQHLVDGIYFTNRNQKHPYMAKQGIIVNVWIDDFPAGIPVIGDSYTRGE